MNKFKCSIYLFLSLMLLTACSAETEETTYMPNVGIDVTEAESVFIPPKPDELITYNIDVFTSDFWDDSYNGSELLNKDVYAQNLVDKVGDVDGKLSVPYRKDFTLPVELEGLTKYLTVNNHDTWLYVNELQSVTTDNAFEFSVLRGDLTFSDFNLVLDTQLSIDSRITKLGCKYSSTINNWEIYDSDNACIIVQKISDTHSIYSVVYEYNEYDRDCLVEFYYKLASMLFIQDTSPNQYVESLPSEYSRLKLSDSITLTIPTYMQLDSWYHVNDSLPCNVLSLSHEGLLLEIQEYSNTTLYDYMLNQTSSAFTGYIHNSCEMFKQIPIVDNVLLAPSAIVLEADGNVYRITYSGVTATDTYTNSLIELLITFNKEISTNEQ